MGLAFGVQLAGVRVLPLGGLHDPALLDAGGFDLDATRNPVNDSVYRLKVGSEGTPGDTCHLGTDTTETLGFTSGRNRISDLGSGTGEMANSGHGVAPEKASRSLYPNPKASASLWCSFSTILGR